MTARNMILLGAAFLAGCSAPKTEDKQAETKPALDRAPDVFRARFVTTRGDFVIEASREWAPRGADRFYELVSTGFYNGSRFYRYRRNFVVQWGISPDPSISRLWANLRLPDDPVKQSNQKGAVSFAAAGPASRTTQVFVNLADNKMLDKSGFAPFGRVVEGMDIVEGLYSGYGEMAPRGMGPDPARIEMEGEAYLERSFPRLDTIKKAVIAP